ncbi:KAT8 regulatory NSL complex subunit 3 isoform X2 [Drosophila grimshawi]|uniref:KAT8 regulatory NSL complex subunit 3 isoform X2 n=1 Tax=Drosophila grimshawi TaxID=7222 RepID=UPI000C86F61E|nr:KAT8 regulatory NSL complex subunit 3 isoform X2 [Drosophila grimshawi]
MLPAKQTKSNKNEIVVLEQKPKMQSSTTPSASIITYSPSKFIARAAPTTYTKLRTHTNTNITRAATTTASAAKIPANTSYYVVKAGQLGSAASILSSPPKLTAAVTPAVTSAAAAATATIPSESSSTISVPSEASMEHTYMRDAARPDNNNSNTNCSNTINNGLAPARTILVRHAPQCPTCHTYPAHEDLSESQQSQAHIPPYDEIAAKEMMNECARIAKYVRNNNSDEQDWQERINRFGWTYMQETLFDKIAAILDQDQLARLANDKRQHEAVHRRVSVDKSSSRMRRILASIAWEPRTTQWLHALLMEHLPPSYMASYLDIMQTLKNKLPTLVDKMLFGRPLNNSQELLAPVMKKRWQPDILAKSRHLAHNAIIVAVPNMPTSGPVPERMQNWYQALATISQVVQITLPNTNDRIGRQNLDQVAETIVSLIRVRIHELRTENPNRGIILIGFNAGAAMALQVAMSESIACVICLGFAFNTLRGPRGTPDDRLLDIKTPILFIIGQNSARSSQEEMEGLRERMQSESSLLVVGSADDALRVPKSKRRIEGVTQAMVDSMVVDEIYEFLSKTLSNPPGPRMPTPLLGSNSYQRQSNKHHQQQHVLADGNVNKAPLGQGRKRKAEAAGQDEGGGIAGGGLLPAKTKFVPHICISTVGRPRTRPLPAGVALAAKTTGLSNEEMNMSIESILEEYDDSQTLNTVAPPAAATLAGGKGAPPVPATTVVKPSQPTTVSLASGTKIKMIPPSQFVQLKSLPNSQTKLVNYTISKAGNGATMATAAASGGTTTASIGSIVKTLPTSTTHSGHQVFTLKTPTGQTTQFQTAGGAVSTPVAAAQQKYTVIKNANGLTMLQVTKNVPTTSSSVDYSNIIDMPIVFADNEGNISEQQQQQQQEQLKTVTSSAAPLIITQKIIKDPVKTSSSGASIVTNSKGIVINKNIQQLLSNSGNKVVYLNRNAMKTVTTATGAGGGGVATTGRLSGSVPIRIVSSSATSKPTTVATMTTTTPATTSNSSQVLLEASHLRSLNLRTLKTPVLNTTGRGGLRVGNKTISQFQIINNTAAGGAASGPATTTSKLFFNSGMGLKPFSMVANRSSLVSSSSSTTIPAMAPGGAAVRRVLNIGAVTKPGAAAANTTTMTVSKDSKIMKATTTTPAGLSKSKEPE